MGTLYRAQLLIEPEQHEALAEIAKMKGLSISQVMREILAQYLEERKETFQRQRRKQALQELIQLRKELEAKQGPYPGDPIAEVRAEREEDIERVWRGEA